MTASRPEVRSVAKTQPLPLSADVTPSSCPPPYSFLELKPSIAVTFRVAGSRSTRLPARPAGTRTFPSDTEKRRSSKPMPLDPPGISIAAGAAEASAPKNRKDAVESLIVPPRTLILKQLLYASIKCYMRGVRPTLSRKHAPGRGPEGALRWYLLIHQLPPQPLYLRAKIRQRLSRIGAVALKNAVYVLPRLEDLQWIAQEAVAGSGEAYVSEAAFLQRRTDEALVEQFRAEREAEYRALEKSLGAGSRKEEDPTALLSRARKRFEEISRIDFFAAPGRRRVAARLEALSRRSPLPRGPARARLTGRLWTTRRGVHVDRIASAWL